MKAKITKRTVDETKAKQGKPLVVFDTELAGFVLKVTPAQKKIYQFRYRMGGRGFRLITYTIGPHGAVTPDQARKIAHRLRGEVAQGIDPSAIKIQKTVDDRAAPTIAALSTEFLNIYCSEKLKPRTLVEYRRAFTAHINPNIGHLKVRDATHSDIEKLQYAMRGTRPAANRTTSVLSIFYSWAIRAGHRRDQINPVRGLQKYKEQPRERYLSTDEIVALGNAIVDCAVHEDISPWHAAIFQCLLLTGMRRDELRTLRWTSVDLVRGLVILEDSKVGRRSIPIATAVVDILTALPRLSDNPYVFCGSKSGQPIINLAKSWKRVVSKAGIAPARIHDLRHTTASVAAAAGSSLLLIGGVLGHKSSRTTQRYAHLAEHNIRLTCETISKEIAKALDPCRASQPASMVKSKWSKSAE